MFRKSVSFFILVALMWVLLWVYVPDASPNNFTLSDLFRGLLLLFSFMASSFALLMLTIRYKGVDIATNLIPKFLPQAGIVMWLGKHAYEFSQPKTTLNITYQGSESSAQLELNTNQFSVNEELQPGIQKSINLGYIAQNPQISWVSKNQSPQSQTLSIDGHIKKLGRNVVIEVTIDDTQAMVQIP